MFFPVTNGSSLFERDVLCKVKINWSDIAAQCNSIEKNLTVQDVLKEFSDMFEEGMYQEFQSKNDSQGRCCAQIYKG